MVIITPTYHHQSRYIASPKYFASKGSSGMLIPYKPLVVQTCLTKLFLIQPTLKIVQICSKPNIA